LGGATLHQSRHVLAPGVPVPPQRTLFVQHRQCPCRRSGGGAPQSSHHFHHHPMRSSSAQPCGLDQQPCAGWQRADPARRARGRTRPHASPGREESREDPRRGRLVGSWTQQQQSAGVQARSQAACRIHLPALGCRWVLSTTGGAAAVPAIVGSALLCVVLDLEVITGVIYSMSVTHRCTLPKSVAAGSQTGRRGGELSTQASGLFSIASGTCLSSFITVVILLWLPMSYLEAQSVSYTLADGRPLLRD